jgi:RHS repeat-associated protein
MKTYAFNVNGKSLAGTLTWDKDGTVGTLAITDTFNAGGTQTCNFMYDDVGRLGVPPNSPPPPPTPTQYIVDCGSSPWRQVFSYDQYDNLTKTGNPGTSWITTYNPTNNQMTGSYDANGRVTYDTVNTYTWDAYGKMLGVKAGSTPAVCGTSGFCATYDAMGRIVETSTASTYKEILYGPTGRLAQMSGQSTSEVDLPLPGGLMFKTTGTGGSNRFVVHNDWLGSARLATSLGARTWNWDTAYTPYGETYDTFGTPKQDFTGDFQDIFAGLFDTPNRELATNASRWLSPDPAGASWNAYAYVTNPNSETDPTGLYAGGIGAGFHSCPAYGACSDLSSFQGTEDGTLNIDGGVPPIGNMPQSVVDFFIGPDNSTPSVKQVVDGLMGGNYGPDQTCLVNRGEIDAYGPGHGSSSSWDENPTIRGLARFFGTDYITAEVGLANFENQRK